MKIYKRDLTASYFRQLSKLSDYNTPETYLPHNNIPCSNKNNFKPIAFYLPQFYQTYKNDKNWGEGYTEWTASTRAIPNFLNHYQPHLADSLGYYNLTMSDVIKKQVSMAKQYGIYGFCFYFYHFGDSYELRLPLDTFCNMKELNFHFCLCWANENWTRKWDGKNDNILETQKYDKASLTNVIQDACRFLNHNNYIRVNGKPLFIVYNPSEIPFLQNFADDFRNTCLENGIGEIHLSFINKTFDELPQKFGFDSVTEFPPHGMRNLKRKEITNELFHNNFYGEVFDIEDYVNSLAYTSLPYTIFRTAFPS